MQLGRTFYRNTGGIEINKPQLKIMITNYIEKLDDGTIISSSNLRDWINSISKHGSSSMEVSKHLQISKLMIKFGRRGEGLWKKIEINPLKGGLT